MPEAIETVERIRHLNRPRARSADVRREVRIQKAVARRLAFLNQDFLALANLGDLSRRSFRRPCLARLGVEPDPPHARRPFGIRVVDQVQRPPLAADFPHVLNQAREGSGPLAGVPPQILPERLHVVPYGKISLNPQNQNRPADQRRHEFRRQFHLSPSQVILAPREGDRHVSC